MKKKTISLFGPSGRPLFVYPGLLMQILAVIVLTACGGEDGGGNGGAINFTDNDGNDGKNPVRTLATVTNLTVIPGENSIRLGWTNPDRNGIDAFIITWQDTENPADPVTATIARSEPMDVNFTARAITSFSVGGLSINRIYTLRIIVMYTNGSAANSPEIRTMTGVNSDNDNETDLVDSDDDNDGLLDDADNCPLISNAGKEDFDRDGCPNEYDPDDDNDGLLDDADNCPLISNEGKEDFDRDGCPNEYDPDDDNDGVNDLAGDETTQLDACPRGDTGWTSNASADHDGDGCRDDSAEDPDDDNDGVNDLAGDKTTQLDACPRGDTGWTSNTSADHDGDGCRDDSAEDPDDDNDGVNDLAGDKTTQLDACPRGDTGWTSNTSADHDGDGCRDDSAEDPDDDNDGVNDLAGDGITQLDACPRGDTGWTSNASADHDRDGCRDDSAEDPDDDNDGVNDLAGDKTTQLDACPRGDTGWTSNASADYDRDGCRDDSTEDPDDDNDGVNDLAGDKTTQLDACPRGDTGWTSNTSADHDGDGCRDDSTEDPDDDNDGVNDLAGDGITQLDACPRGDTGWTSNASADHDGDGCRDDSTEDPDDDNDGVNDLATNATTRADACPRGDTGWTSNASADNDGDGCRDDSTEDPDDDNDGFPDAANATILVADNCQFTDNPDQANHDGDALGDLCDPDDDNDGVNDLATNETTQSDACPRGDTGWTSNASADHDGDGCRDDSTEDPDDDNDNILDDADSCPLISSEGRDESDRDGCPNDRDVDDDNDGLIEIWTLEDLASIRDDLNADGTDDGRITNIHALGSVGCPMHEGCRGYELSRSLNFSDDASYENIDNRNTWTQGIGWPRIGTCSSRLECQPFIGIFEGNGNTLSEMFINRPVLDGRATAGVALFGSVQNASIQNLHLRDASVTTSEVNYPSMLVGYIFGPGQTNITNVTVQGSVTQIAPEAANNIFYSGGLIGITLNNADVRIRHSAVFFDKLLGRNYIGGLIGAAGITENNPGNTGSVRVTSSYVTGLNITLSGALIPLRSQYFTRFGGLIGITVVPTIIEGSYADIGSITSLHLAGGLVGLAFSPLSVIASYAHIGNLEVQEDTIRVSSIRLAVAGLVAAGGGAESNTNITASYAVTGRLISANPATPRGGLFGLRRTPGVSVTISASYWDNITNLGTVSNSIAEDADKGRSTSDMQAANNTDSFMNSPLYADWANYLCDPNTGEFTEVVESMDGAANSRNENLVPVWNPGNATQYPALACTPDAP